MFQLQQKRIPRIAAALTLAVAVVGCGAPKTKPPTYAQQSDIDAEFARGAGRAPTARTMHQLAGMLAGQNKDAEAHYVLTRLIETYPAFPPAYSDLAELHLRHDRAEEAKVALNAGLAVKENDPVLLNNLGMCHLMEADYGQALGYFDQAAKVAPNNARYQANRALAMGMSGDYDGCLEAYGKIIPEGEAHYNLAVICEARDDDDRAAKEYAQAKILGFMEDAQ